VKYEAQAFFSAVQFLTRLPTPAWTGWEDGRLDRAAPHFALVGGVVGAACGGVLLLVGVAFAPPVAAILALAMGMMLTGALHEDGLADFADGLGARDRGRMLAIMKDSRVGAFGVLALIVVIGLKVAALSSLSPLHGAAILIAAHGVSRAMLYPAIKSLDYARDEGEAKVAPISRAVVQGEWMRTLAFALLTLAPAALLVPSASLALAMVAALLAALATFRAMRARLGGWTGDALGAQQQLTETAFLTGARVWTSI